MAFLVREIQPTPNPNAMKYVLDRPIADQRLSFFDASSAAAHPLAARLFAIEDVTSLLLLGDFVTVNKSPAAKWAKINAAVKRVLAER
jgi:hypothetical protein